MHRPPKIRRGFVRRDRRTGKNDVMRGFWVPIISAEPTARRTRLISGASAQPIAAIAALLVIFWALSHGFWPTWPLWTIVGLLALGLFAGPVAWLVRGRPVQPLAQPAAAVAALLFLSLWMPNARASWHASPLVVVAALLGLGPRRQSDRTARPRRAGVPVSATDRGGRGDPRSPADAVGRPLLLLHGVRRESCTPLTGSRWERCGLWSCSCRSG